MNVQKDKVKIFDTTLRDGEQSAGAGLTKDEKLEIAKQLEILLQVLLEILMQFNRLQKRLKIVK